MRSIYRSTRIFAVLLAVMVVPAALASPVAAEPSHLGWQGEYFANTRLSGRPVVVRQDPEIDFNWGSGSPGRGIPADNFSVRWTRYVHVEAGRYRFTTETDDGVRLFVDGVKIIDQWQAMAPTQLSAEIDLSGGWHSVRMEYYEASGGAVARLSWEDVVRPGSAWRGEYFGNRWLSGAPALTRRDARIDFDWGNGPPAPQLRSDNFSVRWTRELHFQGGRYVFTTETDDGVRLFVDGVKVIDRWREMAPTQLSAEVELTTGWHSVRMEYFEAGGGAVARLSWAEAAQPGSAWRGEYFGNRWLSGAPILTRRDARIDFDWGVGSPSPQLRSDNFSVRWTRDVHLRAGRYRFTTVTDDGVRLYVDGRKIIDSWREMAPSELSAEVELTTSWHSVRMEYFEAGGGAVARLSWERVQVPEEPIRDWRGEYYGNRSLSGRPVFIRNDENVDFDWGLGSPDRRLDPDGFSVRWTRDLQLARGRYRFTAETDDGVRLYIDGRMVIDQWRVMSRSRHTHEVTLAPGAHTIRMEYFEASGAAVARLSWERVSTAPEPVRNWRGEYYGNRNLSGWPVFIRNDEAVDFDWQWGRPDRRLGYDGFSVRWTRDLQLEAGRYRFTTETDDGVRLYIDGQLVIDEWRVMARTWHVYEAYLSQGTHKVRMEYFERTGEASARLTWEGPLTVTARGNLITHLPPYPSYSWIKVYQLTAEDTWRDVSPRGWASLSPDGTVKIDGLPVDYARYGEHGHPYRVEQWVNGRLARAVGDVDRGQAEFRIRANMDNRTPW